MVQKPASECYVIERLIVEWSDYYTILDAVRVGLPDGQYFTSLASILLLIQQKPVFWKSVAEAGILKIKVCFNFEKN